MFAVCHYCTLCVHVHSMPCQSLANNMAKPRCGIVADEAARGTDAGIRQHLPIARRRNRWDVSAETASASEWRFPIGLQRPGTPPNRGDTCRQWPSRAGTRIRAMKTWGRPYVFIGRWRVPPRDGHFRHESPRFGGVPGRWRPIGNSPSEADAVSAETSHRFPRRAIGEFRLMPASVPRAASAGHRRPRRRRAPTPA